MLNNFAKEAERELVKLNMSDFSCLRLGILVDVPWECDLIHFNQHKVCPSLGFKELREAWFQYM